MHRRTLARSLALLALLTPTSAGAVRPDRVWGTYYGGAGTDTIAAMTRDGAGNLYVAGQTFSASGIATPGVEQSVLGGASDVFLAKFTPDGQRVWGTYLGGPGSESTNGLAVDAMGALVVTGSTSSATGIATPASLQPMFAGSPDMFVVKFDADGKRVWGTYIGGPMNDGGGGVVVDADDNIYASGQADGALSFALPGPHDTTPNGSQDVVLLKLDPDGAMVWGTYFGGNKGEGYTQLAILGDAVYVAAETRSEGLATNDAYDKLCGTGNAILARFDSDGFHQFSTYVGGDKEELARALAIAPDGDIVVTGVTSSTSGIATPGAHQVIYGGGTYDGFVVRLGPTGTPRWGTYLGGAGTDVLSGAVLDPAGNLLVAGQLASAGLATANAYQTVFGGIFDAVIAKFDAVGAVRYVSYFGGAGNDNATGGLMLVGADTIYFSGSTSSTASIATPGTHQPMNAGAFDGYLVRFTQGQGDACAADSDCEAEFCTDGVCCEQRCGGDVPDCQVCSLTAGAVADGTCTVQIADATCRPAAGECDVAEQCIGDDPACPSDLLAADDAPCQDGLCSAGMCVPLADPGAPCQDDLDCASGFCVDGVCCDSSCGDSASDDCQACSLVAGAAQDGTCAPLADAAPCDAGMCLAGACIPDEGTTTDDSTTDQVPTSGPNNSDSGGGEGPAPTTGDGPSSAPTPTDSSASDPSDASGEGSDTAGITDGGCGCHSPASGGLPLALLALLALPRRRPNSWPVSHRPSAAATRSTPSQRLALATPRDK